MPAGNTAAFLQQVPSQPGQVEVRLNSATNPVVHTFTNTIGLDIIDCGSIEGFLFVDQVPAASKPVVDPNDPSAPFGIQVQGGGDGKLRLEASDADTLIQILNSSSSGTTIELTNQFLARTSFTHFGTEISELTLRTNDVQPSNPSDGTRVYVRRLVGGIHLTVDTGIATYSQITLGASDTIVEQVIVKTGAGNNRVIVQEEDGDDGTNAIVDFGSNGVGNYLEVHGTGGATLKPAPGTSAHRIVVDQVNVQGGGTVTLEHEATIGNLQVLADGLVTIKPAADGTTISTFGVAQFGEASIQAETVVEGTFTVDGIVTFTGTSAGSTVNKFEVSAQQVEDATGEVRVLGAANVLALDSSRMGALKISIEGLFTLQQRSGSPSQSNARVLTVKSLFIEKDPDTPMAVLDLMDNAMIVDYSEDSPLNDIRLYITHAYDTESTTEHWIVNSVLRDGINSTIAGGLTNRGIGYGEATDLFTTFPATWQGQNTVDSTSVLVKYTYYGDANLDGMVNISDFNRLAANFGQSGLWTQGDFNYDLAVDILDFNRLAANFSLGDPNQQQYTYEELEQMLE